MIDDPCLHHAWGRSRALLPSLATALTVLLSAVPAAAVDLDEVTVVTLARDGSWGAATAASTDQAIAAAIRNCRVMSAPPSDCGAQLALSRGSWVIANLCGDHKILANGKTRIEAEQAAFAWEADAKRLYVPNLTQCRRVLVVDPRGVALPAQTVPRQQLDARQEHR